MKPGQIRPLYLEPRLHKQSVKQEINNHRTCLAKPLHTKQQINGSDQWKLFSRFPKKRDSIFVTIVYLLHHHQNLLPVLNFDFFNLPARI
jgi:hypothetical protein